MVFRIYVEKKKGLDNEARALKKDLNELLQLKTVESVRIFNRYDVENISKELFDYAVKTVFSEPQLDNTTAAVPTGDCVFAVEYLPGQFDQRAASAAECIQIISKGDRPAVKTAKVYVLGGDISAETAEAVKKYVINPVEAREASMECFETLKADYSVPTEVEMIDGFRAFSRPELEKFLQARGLAMDIDDLLFCQSYFIKEQRDPTITEIKMIDTYWSDHCRHTTFLTTVDSVRFEDEVLRRAYDRYISVRSELGRTKPINLMDIATIAVKYLKKQGKLDKLDESEEINACTVKMDVDVDGKTEKWLLLFKNETHNHPTEIEPFGGAATCIGGAIRDPLSGRSYVYAAMRVTGAADPTVPVSQTLKGKLPQRKIVTTAANGYSSYGNQIGLATGQVDEIYHDGYVAKRMEIGAVIGAAPQKNVRRECPAPGDVVILLGGKTGRDGCGGATGSSKSHSLTSLESCGAEVQKGNAPEERKLQRLFRNGEAARLIKRCNDFGAGGVSVAIGELADGLEIDLNKVPKKYEGLDGTELAISESQERMAVVVAAEDAERFCSIAYSENLEATVVAVVSERPYLVMNWNGKNIVNISREFLNSNGAEKHIDVSAAKIEGFARDTAGSFSDNYKKIASDLNICSKRGLSERFDSTIGAGSVVMPFGGKYQLTPTQAMINKVSLEKGDTTTCSFMAWGFDPFVSEKSPYHGTYLAVVESVSKLIASGASFEDVYLTFQEYFEKPKDDPKRWGKPLAALLGAFDAQMNLGIGAIGGKDSMSGTFENIDVPPTLVSFAVTTDNINNVVTPEFKRSGNRVYLFKPETDENGLPETKSLLSMFGKLTKLMRAKKIVSCSALTKGGIAEAALKMSMGNGFGFKFSDNISKDEIFALNYGAFIAEASEELSGGVCIGAVSDAGSFAFADEKIPCDELYSLYENRLESVYPCNIKCDEKSVPAFSFESGAAYHSRVKAAKPRVLIPVFPGTNCEYDTAKSAMRGGCEPEIFVINNLSAAAVSESVDAFARKVRESQIVFIPGGFSGGDEPDGSGKLITAFFRNAEIKEAVSELIEKRDGLMAGICNGFQALIKLGLVPYGKIIDTDEHCPTLTFNTIARHQSKLVRTRVASNKSPWMSHAAAGDIFTVPISHGEGRFLADDELIAKLAKNGQILTQYADLDGNPTMDIRYNPNGSCCAVEGILSPDGRVLGKMGHSERIGNGLYQNVIGNYDMKLFESAAEYFR